MYYFHPAAILFDSLSLFFSLESFSTQQGIGFIREDERKGWGGKWIIYPLSWPMATLQRSHRRPHKTSRKSIHPLVGSIDAGRVVQKKKRGENKKKNIDKMP